MDHSHQLHVAKQHRHKRTRSLSTGSAHSHNSISNLFQKTLNPAHHLRNRIVKKAAGVVDNYVTELTNKSPYLLSCDASNSFEEGPHNHTSNIPVLEGSEIQVGKLLGEGGFCGVYEIVSIHLHGLEGESDEGRRLLAKEPSALVVKQLRKRLTKNPPQFTLAAADLVVEAQYLSRLCHPHIVPVRGMTRGGVHPMQETGRFDAYFLVLDRLEATLDQKIQAWSRGKEIAPSYDQKLEYSLQIAQALEYLHQRRILFRDCKPMNIGFRTDNGALQLFDFGLCRELPPPRERPIKEEEKAEEGEEEHTEDEDEEEEDLDDYYLMTKVGTRRYCAVEMYISGRYNEKIDVYSWAMTVYEMISLCKPFASLTDSDHQEFVCAQGKRPNTKPFLQQCEQPPRGQRNPLLALVREAWEQYVRHRVDIATVVEHMEEIIEDRHRQKQHQQEYLNKSANSDKERQVEGSVVSATTATVTESDHDEMESPTHPHSSLTACSSLSSPPTTPHEDQDDNVDDDDDDDEEEEDIKKDEEITNDSNGEGEDDAGSIHSLSVVDIGIPGSRHSVISAPSLETTSGSEQSSRWDDSINTNEVGLMADASLATLSGIAFDEYLRPRHRGSGLAVAQAESPSSAASGKCVLTSGPVAPSAEGALSPPALGGTTRASCSFLLPALTRIVSMDMIDDDEEDDEDAADAQKSEEQTDEKGQITMSTEVS